MSDTFKLDFKLDIASAIDREKGIIELCTSDARGLISREVMRVKEQAVREGLIALGWAPPGVADMLAAAIQFTKTHHNVVPEECLEHLTSALDAYEARKAGPIMQALKNAHDALVMVADADGDCHRDGLPTIPAAAKATINAAINELESILPKS